MKTSRVVDAMSRSSGPCHASSQPDAPAPKCYHLDMPQPIPIKFAFLPLGITITRKVFDIFKLTVQFVSVYGMYFWMALKKRVCDDLLFEFFKPTDSRHRVYLNLVIGYSSVLVPSKKLMNYQKLITNFDAAMGEVLDGFFKLLDQLLEKKEKEDGVEMAMTDLHAFEYFANMEETMLLPPPPGLIPKLIKQVTDLRPSQQNYPETTSNVNDARVKSSGPCQQKLTQNDDNAQDIQPDAPAPKCCHLDMPQPLLIKFAFLPPQITVTRKEFDVFKLTSQFVFVYGMYFRRALKKRVCENPLFEFFKPTDSRHNVYLNLVIGYSSVLVPSKKLMTYQKLITNFDAATGEVLDGFFKFLDQVPEKEKDGVEIAMTDLRAFEYFANVEETVLQPPPPGFLPLLQKKRGRSQLQHLILCMECRLLIHHCLYVTNLVVD
ncbi:PREDICTED: LOW QUALITY PROTEIN: splicing factor 3A subunit 1-like [Camelina sativa]|uniref:LOW QUALITY PROTEIN: splicing factor 3A subunit 1-like n=1 Tax=Camelina sativa TaxID=90675 RepID=A0ABM0YY44_CAMSA|nr:PREDICTED: LOW QUALITY PROTEIN: splicing factor 3A subunit 1-like [Camelina sativa]